MQKPNNNEGKIVMGKKKKKQKINATYALELYSLSLDAIGLLRTIQKNSDAPRFSMFFLDDIEKVMGSVIKTSHQELMDTMDSLAEKGILSAVHKVDDNGNLIDKIYLVHESSEEDCPMDRRYRFQEPEVEENDLISLKERAVLGLLSMMFENQRSPLKSCSGFFASDMLGYLNTKFKISFEEGGNLIRELVDSGWINFCQIVKAKDNELVFLCYYYSMNG